MFPLDILEITDAMRSQSPSQQVWAEILDHVRASEANQGVGSAGAFATIAARLANFDTVVQGMALATLANLRITPSAATPDDICDISIDTIAVGDPTNGYSILQNVTGSPNAASQGLNGRTDPDPRNVSSYYYIWVGHNPTTGGVGFAYDPGYTRAGLGIGNHASFNGYTRWRRIGARLNNSSGDFYKAYTTDRWTRYDISDALRVHASVNGVAPSNGAWSAAISLGGLIPATSKLARVGCQIVDPNVDTAMFVRPMGGAGEWEVCAAEATDGRARGVVEVDTNDSQQIQWMTSAGATAGQVYLRMHGYHDPV